MPKDYDKPQPGDPVFFDGQVSVVLADLSEPIGHVSIRTASGMVLITDWRELALPKEENTG